MQDPQEIPLVDRQEKGPSSRQAYPAKVENSSNRDYPDPSEVAKQNPPPKAPDPKPNPADRQSEVQKKALLAQKALSQGTKSLLTHVHQKGCFQSVKDLFTRKKELTGKEKLSKFAEDVQKCIKHLNEQRDKHKGNFAAISDFEFLDNSPKDESGNSFWNQLIAVPEIQDWRGCFTYNPYRRLLAVWSDQQVILYQFQLKPYFVCKRIGSSQIFESSIMSGPNSVITSPDGTFMIVITNEELFIASLALVGTTDEVPPGDLPFHCRIEWEWKTELSEQLKQEIEDLGLDLGGQVFKMLGASFHDGAVESLKDQSINTLFPAFMSLNIGSQDFKVEVTITLNPPDRLVIECSILQPNYVGKFTEKDSESPNLHRRLVQTGYPLELAALMIKPFQMVVEPYRVGKTDSTADPSGDYTQEKVFSYKLDPDIRSQATPDNRNIVMVSADFKELFLLCFSSGRDFCSMKSIIQLPDYIKRVNQVSAVYDARFITMNANVGELYVWALLNDGSYGKVMYLDLDHEFTSTYITPDLEYLLLMSPGKMRVLYFDPIPESDDYFIMPSITKLESESLRGPRYDQTKYLSSDFKEFNRLIPLNSELSICIRHNGIFAFSNTDIPLKQENPEQILRQNFIKGDTIRCCEVVEMVPGHAWLLYISYTKDIPCRRVTSNQETEEPAYERESVFQIHAVHCSDSPSSPQEIQSAKSAKRPSSEPAALPKYKPDERNKPLNGSIEMIYSAESSSPFEATIAENVAIIRAEDQEHAFCLKTFTGARAIETPTPEGTRKIDIYNSITTEFKFNLQERLGIGSLQPRTGSLVLLNRDYGVIKSPVEEKAEFKSLSKQATIREGSIQVQKPGTMSQPPGNPLIPTPHPVKDDHFEQHISEHATSILRKLTTSSVHPSPSSSQSPADNKTEKLIGNADNLDQDSFDEGYAEIVFDGMESRTHSKRPTAGVWKFFHLQDLLQGHRPVRFQEKLVHMADNQFVKLSPDSSLLAVYGNKGYELFRFFPTDIQNKVIPKFQLRDMVSECKVYFDWYCQQKQKITLRLKQREEREASQVRKGLDNYGDNGLRISSPPTDRFGSGIIPQAEEENQSWRVLPPKDPQAKADHGLSYRKVAADFRVSDGSLPRVSVPTRTGPTMPKDSHQFEDMSNQLGAESTLEDLKRYKPGVEKRTSFGTKIVAIRYRWKDSYKVSSSNHLEFSARALVKEPETASKIPGKASKEPDTHRLDVLTPSSLAYVAIRFSTGRVLLLEHRVHKPKDRRATLQPNPSDITEAMLGVVSTVNLKLKESVDNDGMCFKFFNDEDDFCLGNLGKSANPEKLRLDIIKLSSRASLMSTEFSKDYKAVHLEIYMNKGTLNFKLMLRRIQEELIDDHLGFKCVKSGTYDSCIVPFRTLLFRNLQYYFSAEIGSKAENVGYDLLENTFRAMSPSSVLQDPRIIICLIVLNKPDLIRKVIQNIGIGAMISSLPVLEMTFSESESNRSNSIVDIAKMYQELNSDPREIPQLPERWISGIIESTEVKGLISTPGTKSIFSQMIFANTGVTIEGLTKSRDLSLVKVKQSQQGNYMPPFAIKSLVTPLMLENPPNSNTYQVYRSHMKLELTNGSAFSIGLFQAIMAQPDSEIRYKFKQLINYKWRMVFYHSLVYTLIYLLMNLLAYLYFGYQATPAVGVCLLALHAQFILFDVKMYSSSLFISSKDLKNWIDLAVHGYSVAICIISLFGLLPDQSLLSYLKILALTAVSIRGIIQLKMFSGIRALIMLMGQIIVDLTWVPFVFVGVLVLAATIYRMIPTPAGTIDPDLTFFESVKQIFMLIFMKSDAVGSDIDTSSGSGVARSVLLLVGGTILMQGVFNFVIAIFIQTFQRVKDDKEVYELRSLLLEIVDYDLFLRGVNFGRKESAYYLFLVPVPKNGQVFENETQFDRINKIKDDIMVEVGKKGIEMVGEKAKKVFQGQEELIDKSVNFMKDNAKETDVRIRNLMSAAQSLSQGKKPEMGDLTNLVSILGDAADGKVRNAIAKTKDAADKAFKYADDVSNDRNPGLDALMDVVVSLADAADNGSLGIGKQLVSIKKIVQECIEQAELLKNPEGVDLCRIIDLVISISNLFGNNDISSKIGGIAGAAKCILQQGNNFVKNTEKVDFEVMLKSITKAIRDCGALKLAKSLESPGYVDTAKFANVLVKNLGNLEIGVPALLNIGNGMVQIVVKDENTKAKVTQVSAACLALYEASDSLKSIETTPENMQFAVKQIVSGATGVIGAFLPENKEFVDQIGKICLGVASVAQSITTDQAPEVSTVLDAIEPVVAMILPKKEGKDIKQAIEGVSLLIKAIVKQIETIKSKPESSTTGSLINNLPDMIQGSGQIVKLFYNNETVNSTLDMAVLTSRLIQSRVGSIGDFSSMDDVFRTSSLALEILSIISPDIKCRSTTIEQGLRLVEKQYKNLTRQNGDIDVRQLIEDVGDLAIMIDGQSSYRIRDFVSLSTLLLDKYSSLTYKLKNKTEGAEYILWTCQTVEEVCSRLDTSLGDRISDYCRGVSGLVRAAQEVKNSRDPSTEINVEVLFSNVAESLRHLNQQASEMVRDAIPVFMIFKALWQGNASSTLPEIEANLLKVLENITKVNVKLKKDVEVATKVVKGLFACVKTVNVGKETVLKLDVNQVIESGYELIKAIEPSLGSKLEPFTTVTKALVNQAMTQLAPEGKLDVNTLIKNVGDVVKLVEPKLGAQVDSLIAVAKSIEELARKKSLKDLSLDSVERLVGELAQLMGACDKRFTVMFETVQPTLKLVMAELRKVSSLELSSKDPKNSIQNLLGLVKRLLTHFKPDLDQIMLKIEWTVLTMMQQVEQCQQSGELQIDQAVCLCADLLSEYSEPLRKPARMIQGIMKVLSSTGTSINLLDLQASKGPGALDWEKLEEGCMQVGTFFGLSADVKRLIGVIRKMVSRLEDSSDYKQKGTWKFSPIMKSIAEVIHEYQRKYSREFDICCSVTEALEAQIASSSTTSGKVLDTISAVAKVLSVIDPEYESQVVTVSEMVSTLSKFLKDGGIASNDTRFKVSSILVLFKPFLSAYDLDEYVVKGYKDIETCVKIFEEVAERQGPLQVSKTIESVGDAVKVFFPEQGKKVAACVTIARLFDNDLSNFKNMNKQDVEKLVDSVIELASKLTNLDSQGKIDAISVIKKTILAVVCTVDKFKGKSHPFADISTITGAATQILQTINPNLRGSLEVFDNLMKVMEEEVLRLDGSKQPLPRDLVLTAQRMMAVFNPAPSSVPGRVGDLLTKLSAFLARYPDLKEAQKYQMLQLALGAIAVVSPSHEEQIQGYISEGFKVLESTTGSDPELFLQQVKKYATIVPIPGLDASKIDQLIVALRKALIEVRSFTPKK